MKYIHLMTLDLETPVYLTDMHRDYDYNGNKFAAGYLSIQQSITQKTEPSANDFSFTLSAIDQTMISAFTSAPYKGRRCLIQRAELNEDQSIKSIETWLDGDLNKYTYTNELTKSIMTVNVGSIFAAFSAVKMVNIGLKFANTINDDQTIYWGKNAPTTTPYSGGRPASYKP